MSRKDLVLKNKKEVLVGSPERENEKDKLGEICLRGGHLVMAGDIFDYCDWN